MIAYWLITHLPPTIPKCVDGNLPVVDVGVSSEGEQSGVVHVHQAVGVGVFVNIGTVLLSMLTPSVVDSDMVGG